MGNFIYDFGSSQARQDSNEVKKMKWEKAEKSRVYKETTYPKTAVHL